MNIETDAGTAAHHIYPRRYFDASPTWFKWNRLFIADVHALRTERGFEIQNVYFCLNYPVQFVRLVGIVTGFDVIHDGLAIFMLDDGSGARIEVKIARRKQKPDDEAVYPSNTLVDNVDVHEHIGHRSICIDHTPISIGSIIRAKGTIGDYRGQRQINLKMAALVKDTNEETKAWMDTLQWKSSMFSTPWILTKEQQDAIDEQARKDVDLAKKKREWNSKQSEKRRKRDEKHELKRRAREIELNAGALIGSNVTKNPWN
ncbi:Hypothetical protein R9X50_00309700 [Acrodontium crateriforme]|uniref:CST complex subunit STN1 n=1 Tax=Acrodontium crateriforme TaxID=150365 RepID=A0AAQ3M2W7_9PEZI|nr:Hypothetical protein R9X50_00309700 [Acrodontium crateriforme]